MSLADELKAAERRLKSLKSQEKPKKKRSSSKTADMWSMDNDIIALYLEKAQATKFLKENYAKKRGISMRAMNTRMNLYKALLKGDSATVPEQMSNVMNEYGIKDVPVLKQIVISILRGEYTHGQVVEEPATE